MQEIRNKRLRALMDELRSLGVVYNDTEFCNRVGKSKSTISSCAAGNRNVSAELVMLIVKAFPAVNDKYLLGEENALMFNEGSEPKLQERKRHHYYQQEQSGESRGSSNSQNDEIIALHKIIEKQQAQIDKLISLLEKAQNNGSI